MKKAKIKTQKSAKKKTHKKAIRKTHKPTGQIATGLKGCNAANSRSRADALKIIEKEKICL